MLPAPIWLKLVSILRKNLRTLVDLTAANDHRNYQRTFWRWLEKQSWRSMLPQPFMCLGVSVSCDMLVSPLLHGWSLWHSGLTWWCKTQVGMSNSTWASGECFCRAICYLIQIWFWAFATCTLPLFLLPWGFLRYITMTGICSKHASSDLTECLVLNATCGAYLILWCSPGRIYHGLRRLNHFGNQWRILIGFDNIQFCHHLILGIVWGLQF